MIRHDPAQNAKASNTPKSARHKPVRLAETDKERPMIKHFRGRSGRTALLEIPMMKRSTTSCTDQSAF
jgi:hypothetical protein